MGFEFLVRARRVTLALTVLAAIAGVVYGGASFGLALALGSLWSLGNLLFLEAIGRLLIAGKIGRAPLWRDVAIVLGGVPILLLGGYGILASGLPLLAATIGFWILFAVVVLKALAITMAKTLDFATGRSAVRPAEAVRRPLPSRRTLGLVGWGLALLFGAAFVIMAMAAPASEPAGAPATGDKPAVAQQEAPSSEADNGVPELPTLPSVIARATHQAPWAKALEEWQDPLFSLLATIVLVVLVRLAFAKPTLVPGRAQMILETAIGGSRDFVVQTFGHSMEPYVPFVGTIFFYILTMNWMGQVPLLKSPTASLNTTAAMAVVVFLFVQFTAIRKQGPFGYLHHLAGSPRDLVGWIVAPVLFPIELMGEFIKPLSLAARLFGNVFGEDLLIAVFVGIGVALLGWQPVPVGFPIHVLFMFLGLVMSAVQALVFALLTTVYLYMALPHDHADDEHVDEHLGAEHGAQPATA
jgi:F-type H+-transporting ATPase subunit a